MKMGWVQQKNYSVPVPEDNCNLEDSVIIHSFHVTKLIGEGWDSRALTAVLVSYLPPLFLVVSCDAYLFSHSLNNDKTGLGWESSPCNKK